jgi:two-component system, cell cycle sensor histidine kinase and response regulator CckA
VSPDDRPEESVLRISIDHLLEGVQVIGFDWRYRYVNAHAAGHGERPIEALLGRTMLEVNPRIEETAFFVVLQRVMNTRRSQRLINEFSYPDGTSRWFDLRVEPVPAGICVLSIDITDQRLAELQLQQAQKMEIVGKLVSGIAHDFNNMLTVIVGYAEMLTSQLGPDKPIGRDLQEIVAAGEQASALTAQLLAFARKQPMKQTSISLNDIVARVEPMLRRLMPANIAVDIAMDPAIAGVWADAIQLEQVILNLAVNARDAMAGGGTLTVSTRMATQADQHEHSEHAIQAGSHVALSVRDTGIGMTADVRAHVFEAFYTTKREGRGTGLGLAVVHGIVSRVGGSVAVSSTPGHGSQFTILLPVTDLPARAIEAPVRTASPVGRETILLVEDEPGVRVFTSRVLQRYGYRVVEAESAETAIARLASESLKVDLLLADLVLPGMDGTQLAVQIHRDHPTCEICS